MERSVCIQGGAHKPQMKALWYVSKIKYDVIVLKQKKSIIICIFSLYILFFYIIIK